MDVVPMLFRRLEPFFSLKPLILKIFLSLLSFFVNKILSYFLPSTTTYSKSPVFLLTLSRFLPIKLFKVNKQCHLNIRMYMVRLYFTDFELSLALFCWLWEGFCRLGCSVLLTLDGILATGVRISLACNEISSRSGPVQSRNNENI